MGIPTNRRVIDVLDPKYGLPANEEADCLAAFNAVRADIEDTKGAVILLPQRDFYLSDSWDLRGIDHLALISHGGRIVTDTVIDAIELGSATDFATGLTYYTLDGTNYARAALSVTLADEGDAANFTAGDYIYIRCRNVGTDNTPVAELNKVRSISGAVLTLEWPLAKDYIFDASYPWGVAVAGDAVVHDGLIQGLHFSCPLGRPFHSSQFLGFTWEKCKVTGRSGPIIRGRNLRTIDDEVNLIPDWTTSPLRRPYFLAHDTSTTDFWIERMVCRSEGIGIMHLHEGCANGIVSDCVFYMPVTDADENAELAWGTVSIRGLSWNLKLRDCTFFNHPGTNPCVDAFGHGTYTEGDIDLQYEGLKFYGSSPANQWAWSRLSNSTSFLGIIAPNGTGAGADRTLRATGDSALVVGDRVEPGTTDFSVGTGHVIKANIGIMDS